MGVVEVVSDDFPKTVLVVSSATSFLPVPAMFAASFSGSSICHFSPDFVPVEVASSELIIVIFGVEEALLPVGSSISLSKLSAF